jgi:DNA-binding CsgD family transcriptional regulator
LRNEAGTKTAPHESDAIFSPNGRIQHAEALAKEPGAMDQLRRAVLDLEKARGPRRERQASVDLNAWKGLVDARWSLLDRFETDGKRYIVARENAPLPPGHESLTLRERQVLSYAALGHENKVIAYDLGIAHSTVRVLMARAASKLGATSRSELLTSYATHHKVDDAPPSSSI